jgi:hypothetical protein
VWRWRITTAGQTGRKLHQNRPSCGGRPLTSCIEPHEDIVEALEGIYGDRQLSAVTVHTQLKPRIQLTDESMQKVCRRHGPESLPCLFCWVTPLLHAGGGSSCTYRLERRLRNEVVLPFGWRQIAGRRPKLRPEIRSSEGGSRAACKDRIQQDRTARLLSGSGCRPS